MSSLLDIARVLKITVQDPMVYSLWCTIFTAMILLPLFIPSFRVPKLPGLPIVLEEEIPNKKLRVEKYLTDTRNLLVYGYKKFKDQIFGITTTEGTTLVLPLKFLDDLKGHKSLSFTAVLEEEFTLKTYTKLGNLTDAQIKIVTKDLNSTLPQYTPVIHELIREHWPVGNFTNPTPIKLYPQINELVSRVCARFFLGAHAANDPRWISIAQIYIQSAFEWTGSLKAWPKSLRPLVHPFVRGRNSMVQQFNTGKSIVAETLAKKKENGNEHLSNPPSLLDLLTSGELARDVDNVEGMAIVQMNLCVAAIQSMAAQIMQCVINLSIYDEYVPGLREEVESALNASGGKMDRAALQKLWKLDSFMKETGRHDTLDLMGFQRKVQEPLTMSNGMHIPVGARIVLPTGAINMDSNYYDHPAQFDGLRFYRRRIASETEQNKHQFVSVGKTDLAWGYGRHACPGRFIAEVAMKLVLVEFLVKYEIEPPVVGARPTYVEHEGVSAPDPEWELLLTNRKSRTFSLPPQINVVPA
ncbi:uncharacterized protein K452DRAFT_281332 [Aplosporella prunicola CBS 121167]|uniref:Cytochrome P450 n=1 Tax=Aplosporella prunicola CBS 121167 TaxID=1176127 RepID=A0A6A6AYF8_9PEZI|nr:uncharacterized protein K452DRAFT_281332 [Aplosporella prunicola CBS 121167]KAF2135571.1 hypothetical protein K452DRAFT_281332 [Aplosporella prunicola CBS 121167]